MAKVIIVLLRRPIRSNPKEMRTDPFWEFGSFGCTGCHRRNLLNPKSISELAGVRLGFVQGGHCEMRLVLLTPPITIERHKIRCETKWSPTKPFRFDRAPLVIDNEGNTAFPCLLPEFADTDRTTLVGCFSSAFRTRRHPLPAHVGNALIHRWDKYCKHATEESFAQSYEQVLPFPPPTVDHDRERSYHRAVRESDGRRTGSRSCRSQP